MQTLPIRHTQSLSRWCQRSTQRIQKPVVFFGTNEIPLELDGIKYTGEATLPLSEDYAGNVTFLFVDGNKRSTEVLDKFEGVTSVFKNVASGILADKPTFDNGSIKLGTDVDVAVMGK